MRCPLRYLLVWISFLASLLLLGYLRKSTFKKTSLILTSSPPVSYNVKFGYVRPVLENETTIIVVISSRAREKELRNSIRTTWGSVDRDRSLPLRIAFFIGVEEHMDTVDIIEESRRHEDIVIIWTLKDTYRGLTQKILVAMEWTSRKFPGVKFLLKCDSDIFVDIGQLLLFLPRLDADNHFIMGRIFRGVKPVRRPNDIWYIPAKLYPEMRFPDYINGPSYLMPMKTAKLLAIAGLNDNATWPLEDVYITGILAKRFHIPLIHNRKMSLMKRGELVVNGITYHYMNPNIMRHFWSIYLATK